MEIQSGKGNSQESQQFCNGVFIGSYKKKFKNIFEANFKNIETL